MVPKVVQVRAISNYTLLVYFDDGRIKRYSVEPLLEEGGVFAQLKDPEFFSKCLTVLNGTVAWSPDFNPENCIDIDPLVIYKTGEDVTHEYAWEE